MLQDISFGWKIYVFMSLNYADKVFLFALGLVTQRHLYLNAHKAEQTNIWEYIWCTERQEKRIKNVI